jgi:hypothetical protein
MIQHAAFMRSTVDVVPVTEPNMVSGVQEPDPDIERRHDVQYVQLQWRTLATRAFVLFLKGVRSKSMSNVRLEEFRNVLARLEVYRVWSWAVRYAVCDTERASGQNRTVVTERNSGFEDERIVIKRGVLLMHWGGCRIKTKPKTRYAE